MPSHRLGEEGNVFAVEEHNVFEASDAEKRDSSRPQMLEHPPVMVWIGAIRFERCGAGPSSSWMHSQFVLNHQMSRALQKKAANGAMTDPSTRVFFTTHSRAFSPNL